MILEDLGSKNGTFLRGQRISAPTPLADGDVFRLGRVEHDAARRPPDEATQHRRRVTRSAPMIGQTLSHYRIVEKLGEGGMGILYRARDVRLDRDVAIKVLRPEALGDAARRRRLVQEAKAASALNHAHIVTVYDVGQAPVDGHDVDFIVMECLEGRTLAQVMAERRLGLGEALDCAVQIAEALAAAHAAGIVHRDVKPANVMLSDAGRVKVLDFGLAKLVDRDSPALRRADRRPVVTRRPGRVPARGEGAVLGTAAYMSPEQAEGKPVDARSDVFSLGSVLYEMLAGRRPFQGDSQASLVSAILRDAPPPLRSLRKDVPRDLERVVRRCLAKSRDERYASAGELLLDLVACRARVAARASGWRAALRQPRYVVPPVLAALALAAFLGWTWKRGAPARWARDVALPEIDRLVASERLLPGLLAGAAGAAVPAREPAARPLLEGPLRPHVRSSTNPPGADVFMKSYRAPDGEWKRDRADSARGLPGALRDAPLADHQGRIRARGRDLDRRGVSGDPCDTRWTRRAPCRRAWCA